MRKISQILVLSFALLFLGSAAFAQNPVTGKVTDANGAAVAGATVTVKGTRNAVQTGADGSFRISAPANATLVISSIGFARQEIVTDGKTAVSVNMVQINQQMNEVVVVGYGTARKKDLTGSIATVTAKDFQKGNITTPEQMIAGKIPGVSIISNGGQPGSGSTIRIRGGSSLAASNDPLIVIDGVPLDHNGINGASNPLSFINADDIESFTVLKDASAAAIYGTRAANGVIIITTKKGRSGALKLSFTTLTSVSAIYNKVDVLDGDQVRAIVNANGTATQKSWLGTSNTDWQDAIYHTATSSDNNINISGGIKKLPYRLSLGYQYLNGILLTDHLQKTSIGLAVNPTFFDNHLKVDINLKASSERTRFADQGAIGGAVSFDPTQSIYSGSPRYGGYTEWLESNGDLRLNRGDNPLGLLEQTYDNQKPSRSIGNIQFDYKFPFLPDLHANLNLGYDVSKNTGTRFVTDSAAVAYVIGKPGIGGSNQYNKQTKNNGVFDFYFNYVKDLSFIKSRVDATAGYSYNNYSATTYNYRGLNGNGDTIAGSLPVASPYYKDENVLIGVFGRLNYTYNSKYLLTATIRRDGSSRFGPGNKWGTFPSVALAWKIKDENFLKNSNVISDLKLRAGYGIAGQQDGIGDFQYLSHYSLNAGYSSYQFGNTYFAGHTPSGFDPNLKWESTTTYNAAIDYGFLNNRITGSVDFYIKKTNDLLNSVVQPAGTNFTAYILSNVGDMENKGVEFNINATPVKKKDLTWDVNFNVTYNKNTITNLTTVPDDPNYVGNPHSGAAGVNGFIYLDAVGSPKNTFYLFHQIYDANGKPIEGLFEDVNRDGIINEKDKYKGKTADPNVFMGFSTNVAYKKWNGGFVLRSNLNNYVYNNVASNLGKLNQVDGVYTIGNASTSYLKTGFTGGSDLQGLSDYYVENASFLKMDNLFVGYNFGKVYRKKVGLRLNASIQNVFTITNYTGLDPEVGSGIDNNLYPRPRTYSLGANLDF